MRRSGRSPVLERQGEGFENKIANIIGEELKLPVVYTWFPKATGFVRMTLGAKRCDLVIGWGQGDDMVLNTNAIYRSTSALIYKKGTGLDGVDSLADPRLQGKRIGAQQASAGATLAAKYGLMSNVHGYPLMVDRRYANPAEDMINDIRKGEVDAGILWGRSLLTGRRGTASRSLSFLLSKTPVQPESHSALRWVCVTATMPGSDSSTTSFANGRAISTRCCSITACRCWSMTIRRQR